MTEAVIYDTLRKAYWRPNAAGYTDDIRKAGLYSLQEIAERNAKLSCRRLVPIQPPADGPSTGIATPQPRRSSGMAVPPQAAPPQFLLPVAAPAVSGAIPEGPEWRGQNRREST